MNLQSKQKIRLQDEINNNQKGNISAKFEISSDQIDIPLHNIVKYSRIVQEEIKKNEFLSNLGKNIQKVSIKYKNSIITFLRLLNDEETEMKNDEFTDLLKLSEIFKVDQLKNVLKKYLQNHSKDVDFILSLKIEKESNKEAISILNDDVSEEMEECLKENINECLENDKIKQISVSSIYRMIEHSCRERISNDLLCGFIIESIKERHVLFHFVEIEKLSEKMFEKLIKIYSKFNTSENNHTHYFDFLPNNVSYINKLLLKQKFLEKRIQELEQTNEKIAKDNKQKEEEIQKINQQHDKRIQELEQTKDNIIKQKENEIKLKVENIDKIEKESLQYKKEINQLKQIIQTNEQKCNDINQHVYEIIEYLTKEVGGNVHDKGIVNVTASSAYNNDFQSKNAVDIHNNSNYFASQDLPNSWLNYDFIKRRVLPTGYSITTKSSNNYYHPRNWVIEGSNNNNDWEILDTRQDEKSLMGLNVTRTFEIRSQAGFYRYLRMRLIGKDSDNRDYLALSSLDFIGILVCAK